MPTLRQKKVAKAIVENLKSETHQSAGEVLKSVGYGTGLQNQPKRVIESAGVQEELIAYGFHPEKAKEVVSEILIAGENDTVKLKAADMIFKVHGSYAAEKHVSLIANVGATDRIIKLAELLKNAAHEQVFIPEGKQVQTGDSTI